jgi:hypothetical protein
MRHYVKAAEMKAAGIDWKAVCLLQWKAGKLAVLDEILKDPAFATEARRIEEFAARGGGARATYFRQLRIWRKAMANP